MGKNILDSAFDALGNAMDKGMDSLGNAMDKGMDALGNGIDSVMGGGNSDSSKNDDVTVTKNTDGSTTIHIPNSK
jgi:hypothetical protein